MLREGLRVGEKAGATRGCRGGRASCPGADLRLERGQCRCRRAVATCARVRLHEIGQIGDDALRREARVVQGLVELLEDARRLIERAPAEREQSLSAVRIGGEEGVLEPDVVRLSEMPPARGRIAASRGDARERRVA